MIARHSLEQSVDGEGVEVIENKDIEDPVHGKGQFTEKRIHLSRLERIYTNMNCIFGHCSIINHGSYFSRLPYWIQAICPRVFYITEKSWNYYPFTKTGGLTHEPALKDVTIPKYPPPFELCN